jgi:hypothetical protein
MAIDSLNRLQIGQKKNGYKFSTHFHLYFSVIPFTIENESNIFNAANDHHHSVNACI